jgi:hypothetical protein
MTHPAAFSQVKEPIFSLSLVDFDGAQKGTTGPRLVLAGFREESAGALTTFLHAIPGVEEDPQPSACICSIAVTGDFEHPSCLCGVSSDAIPIDVGEAQVQAAIGFTVCAGTCEQWGRLIWAGFTERSVGVKRSSARTALSMSPVTGVLVAHERFGRLLPFIKKARKLEASFDPGTFACAAE